MPSLGYKMSDTFDHMLDAFERNCNGDDDYYSVHNEQPQCKYCGTYKVVWRQMKGQWCLYDIETHSMHKCIQYYMKKFGARKRK